MFSSSHGSRTCLSPLVSLIGSWYRPIKMSDHPGLKPPFDESEAVQKARGLAKKLAASELPIAITGEAGTGRRTLAMALSDLRRGSPQRTLIQFNGFDGVAGDLRKEWPQPPVVLLFHLRTLDQRGQTELADLLQARRALLVAIDEDREDAALPELIPQLKAAVEATTVTLPALRDRGSDSVLWARYFVQRAARDVGHEVPRLDTDAETSILTHRWPGNLTELDSVIRKAVLLGDDGKLSAADLGFGEEFVVQPLKDAIEQFKMEYVVKVLDRLGGNKTKAARALGIDPRTMFRYQEKLKRGPT